MTATASPAKLRNGSWGARVPGTARKGQALQIQARSGKSWDAVVDRVLWTGADRQTGAPISLCATRSLDRPSSGYVPAVRNARGYVEERGHYEGYCGYPCPVSGRKCCPANGPCHDCL